MHKLKNIIINAVPKSFRDWFSFDNHDLTVKKKKLFNIIIERGIIFHHTNVCITSNTNIESGVHIYRNVAKQNYNY